MPPPSARPAHLPRTPFWALTGYSLMLFAVAVIPPVGLVIRHGRWLLKLHHIGAFAVYVALAWWFFGSGPMGATRPRRLGAACALSFLFGVFIELVQLFLSYRSAQSADLLHNAVGIGIGAAAVALWNAAAARRGAGGAPPLDC